MSKVPRFVQITAKHQGCPFFHFIPKYLDNAPTDFA